MIRMPATASPRTNFDAPSIEPKNSASWAISRRRRFASASLIRPAFRSASMAICLPGMASRVKRALTSAIRPAPLVMTTKLMMVKMTNTTSPTAVLPPTIKCPKASMTLPAASPPSWPWSSTMRVEATFSDNRNRVVTSRTVGKAEKSRGRLRYNATRITISDRAMLKVKKTSSRKTGKGRTIMASTMMISTGAASCARGSRSPGGSGRRGSQCFIAPPDPDRRARRWRRAAAAPPRPGVPSRQVGRCRP